MFEKEYGLTYGDLNCDGQIRISTILNLLQDISGVHSTFRNAGEDKLKELSMVWLLEGWRLELCGSLEKNSPVTVKTGIMKMTELRSYRKYEIIQNGERKLCATGVWFAVDTEKMRIKKIPPYFEEAFDSVSEEDNQLPFENVRPLKECAFSGEKVVEKRDLDTNHHLNNVKSVEIALDYLPEGFEMSGINVKYRKEILKGELIKIYSGETEKGVQLDIKNEADEVCVTVSVSGKHRL